MQQQIITDQQRKALEVCFQKIKADYVQLAPYTIMARIINIEGKDAHQAIKGYQLMRSIGVIPDSFVKGGPEIEKKILKTYFHPVMCEMITRFGLEMDNMNLVFKAIRPGGQPLAIETATQAEVEAYTKEYREVNKVGIGEQSTNAPTHRASVRAFGLSLEDDEELENKLDNHAAIDKELGIEPSKHNRETQKIILQQAIKQTRDQQQVEKAITKTILGLDANF